MSIILDLQPEIEQGLLALATARGVSLSDYVKEIITRQAGTPPKHLWAARGGLLTKAKC